MDPAMWDGPGWAGTGEGKWQLGQLLPHHAGRVSTSEREGGLGRLLPCHVTWNGMGRAGISGGELSWAGFCCAMLCRTGWARSCSTKWAEPVPVR